MHKKTLNEMHFEAKSYFGGSLADYLLVVQSLENDLNDLLQAVYLHVLSITADDEFVDLTHFINHRYIDQPLGTKVDILSKYLKDAKLIARLRNFNQQRIKIIHRAVADWSKIFPVGNLYSRKLKDKKLMIGHVRNYHKHINFLLTQLEKGMSLRADIRDQIDLILDAEDV